MSSGPMTWKLNRNSSKMTTLPNGVNIENNIITGTSKNEDFLFWTISGIRNYLNPRNTNITVYAGGGNDRIDPSELWDVYVNDDFRGLFDGGDGDDEIIVDAGGISDVRGGKGFDQVTYYLDTDFITLSHNYSVNGDTITFTSTPENEAQNRDRKSTIIIRNDVELISDRAGSNYLIVEDLLKGVERYLGKEEAQAYKDNWISGGSLSIVEGYVYRLFNQSTGKHLFSSNQQEIDIITGQGWVNEGASYASPASSTTDLHRFSMANGGHLYTANAEEKNILSQDSSFTYEGVAYQVYSTAEPPQGSTPVVRYLSNAGSHLYSTSLQEQANLNASAQWTNEGIAWYGESI